GVGKFSEKDLLTTGKRTLGTLHYMSPEQLEAPDKIDHRSDLFSVGTMLYELLTGKHPFLRADETELSLFQIGSAIIDTAPPPLAEVNPETPGYVAPMVEGALVRDRKKRYQSAREFSTIASVTFERYEAAPGRTAPLDLVGTLPAEPPRFDPEFPTVADPSK